MDEYDKAVQINLANSDKASTDWLHREFAPLEKYFTKFTKAAYNEYKLKLDDLEVAYERIKLGPAKSSARAKFLSLKVHLEDSWFAAIEGITAEEKKNHDAQRKLREDQIKHAGSHILLTQLLMFLFLKRVF